jgi:hypothetical protein
MRGNKRWCAGVVMIPALLLAGCSDDSEPEAAERTVVVPTSVPRTTIAGTVAPTTLAPVTTVAPTVPVPPSAPPPTRLPSAPALTLPPPTTGISPPAPPEPGSFNGVTTEPTPIAIPPTNDAIANALANPLPVRPAAASIAECTPLSDGRYRVSGTLEGHDLQMHVWGPVDVPRAFDWTHVDVPGSLGLDIFVYPENGFGGNTLPGSKSPCMIARVPLYSA